MPDSGVRNNVNINNNSNKQRSLRNWQTQTPVKLAAISHLHIMESSEVLEGYNVARIAYFRGS